MSSIFLDIDKFRNNQKIISLEREINDASDDDRAEVLKQQLEELKPKTRISAKQSLDDLFKKIDDNQYKQNWRYLTPYQKEIKLKEFDNDISSADLEELKNCNKGVKYDPVTEKVVKIGK